VPRPNPQSSAVTFISSLKVSPFDFLVGNQPGVDY